MPNLHTIVIFDDEHYVQRVIDAFRKRYNDSTASDGSDDPSSNPNPNLRHRHTAQSQSQNVTDDQIPESTGKSSRSTPDYDVSIEVVNEPGNVVVTSSHNPFLEELIAFFELNRKDTRIERIVVVEEFQNGWPVVFKILFYFVIMAVMGWAFYEINSSKYARNLSWWFPYLCWGSWMFGVVIGLGRIFAYFYLTPREQRPDVNLY